MDGRIIAQEIRNHLKSDILTLKSRNIIPKIAIITLGDESSWKSYVSQKIKVADELGIKAVLLNLADTSEEMLLKTISEIDRDPLYHGIIVQRPMPSTISKEKVISAISAEKDIDGFRPHSPFEVPVWLAVLRLIKESGIMNQESWKDKNFVVIGKGETAGGPIANGLSKLGVNSHVIDSKTENREELLKNADVIVSCVGRREVIKPEDLKEGVYLIGVGTHSEDGKLRGDYVDSAIESIAKFYTPTPGGVGPINLSYLFSNLIQAAAEI